MTSSSLQPPTFFPMDMTSSGYNQATQQRDKQLWGDYMQTPTEDKFSLANKNVPSTFMTSPPSQAMDFMPHESNGLAHNAFLPSQDGSQQTSVENGSHARSTGTPVTQYACFSAAAVKAHNQRILEANAVDIVSPIPRSPGLSQSVENFCQKNGSKNQSYAALPQDYRSNRVYGTLNTGISDMRLGLQRSHSAIQMSTVAQNTRPHPDQVRQLQAAHLQSNGIGRRSITPQTDTRATTGLARQYRPAVSAVVPARAFSQPVPNPRHSLQGIETAYELQQPDVYQSPPATGISEEQDNSPTRILAFANYEEALASQLPMREINPRSDTTYPATPEATQDYVVELVDAMSDMSEATDSEKVQISWKEFLGNDPKGIEVTCWIIVDATMRAHRQKEPLVAPRSKNARPKFRFASFQDHIEALCHGMRLHKTICQHLMAPDYTDGYIDNPIQGADRVSNNRKVNAKKKETIDHGRQAERSMRQTSELYPPLPSQRALPSTEQDEPVLASSHIKHRSSPDETPKAPKSKKRKSADGATIVNRKKSKASRASNFPIQQGPDGRHYVLDASNDQLPAQSSRSHPAAFQPVNQQPIDPSLFDNTSNNAISEPIPQNRSLPPNRSHQVSRNQQAYEDQKFEQPKIRVGHPYPQTYDGTGYDEPGYARGGHPVAGFAGVVYAGADFNGVSLNSTGYNNGVGYVPVVNDEEIHNGPARQGRKPAPLTLRNTQVEAPPLSAYHDLSGRDFPMDPFAAGPSLPANTLADPQFAAATALGFDTFAMTNNLPEDFRFETINMPALGDTTDGFVLANQDQVYEMPLEQECAEVPMEPGYPVPVDTGSHFENSFDHTSYEGNEEDADRDSLFEDDGLMPLNDPAFNAFDA